MSTRRVGKDTTAAVGSRRGWRERIDDPNEPLFTLSIAADLLGLDVQALRRLEVSAGLTSTRPSGNQRRYSRADLETLARAVELTHEGTQGPSVGRILGLERQIADLDER